APAYGYPQQAGYQTPAGYAQQPPSTPPPYNLTPPAPSAGGGKSNRPVVIGSIAVSLVAVIGLIVALALNNGGGDDNAGGGGSGGGTASAAASQASGYRGPDASKTIEKTKCTEPQESYDDPAKIQVPDFKFKYIRSVKQCFQAAGWQMKIVSVDENTYGDGTVMEQFPSSGTDVDPRNVPTIELKVSTGNPPTG
ncbi:PASTA domain-containing protein, partial [Streptomyces shenzhenensis]|uniref:PASTA domain-containing protein n=1 Tax=Streptomyces shenzhenensis TaxID=943815 RepID=UPI0015EFDDB5